MPGVNRIRNILLGTACINRSDRWLFRPYLDPLQQRKYQIDYIMQHSICFSTEYCIYQYNTSTGIMSYLIVGCLCCPQKGNLFHTFKAPRSVAMMPSGSIMNVNSRLWWLLLLQCDMRPSAIAISNTIINLATACTFSANKNNVYVYGHLLAVLLVEHRRFLTWLVSVTEYTVALSARVPPDNSSPPSGRSVM